MRLGPRERWSTCYIFDMGQLGWTTGDAIYWRVAEETWVVMYKSIKNQSTNRCFWAVINRPSCIWSEIGLHSDLMTTQGGYGKTDIPIFQILKLNSLETWNQKELAGLGTAHQRRQRQVGIT